MAITIRDETATAAAEYLAKRGITPELMPELGIRLAPIEDIRNYIPGLPRNLGYHADSVVILMPHYTIAGEDSGYSVGRIIEPPIRSASFRTQLGISSPKLLCPGGKIPTPHFSTLNPPLKDTIYITESRIKADCIAMHGKYAIGVNGVWGWSSKSSAYRMLPELWELPWNSIKNFIFVPDSNVHKIEVMAAVVQFAGAMRIRGIDLKLLKLPQDPMGEDWGFDDYAVHHGRKDTSEFLESDPEEVENDELTSMMWKLNEEVVLIRSLSRYANIKKGYLMTYNDLVKGTYGNWVVFNEKNKPVNAAQAWNTWKNRREVEELKYEPGHPRIVENEYLNLWQGMAAKRVENPYVDPFIKFMENNISDSDERKWVIQWLAYPIQNLGAKLASSLVIVGSQGTGKSMLAAGVAGIYGAANSVMITREQLDSSFNSIYATKQFVVIDEMSKNSRKDAARSASNKLKTLITEEKILVNKKRDPEYEINNHMNVVMTSNYLDALHLEDGDRRFFICQFNPMVDKKHDAQYWSEMAEWFRNHRNDFYSYLLELDLTDFEPYKPAPKTIAKEEMLLASYTDEQSLAYDLINDTEEFMAMLDLPGDVEYVVPAIVFNAWWASQGRPGLAPKRNLDRFSRALTEFNCPKNQVRVGNKKYRGVKITPGDWDNAKARRDIAKTSRF